MASVLWMVGAGPGLPEGRERATISGGLRCPEASPPWTWRQLFPACPGIRGTWGRRSHDLLVCVGSVLSRKVCRPTVGRQALPLRVPTLWFCSGNTRREAHCPAWRPGIWRAPMFSRTGTLRPSRSSLRGAPVFPRGRMRTTCARTPSTLRAQPASLWSWELPDPPQLGVWASARGGGVGRG